MEKKSAARNKPDFEKALKDLEQIAQKLEEGTLGLEESITEFERGMKLARFCQEKLREAERKIEILQKGENGETEKKNLKVKPDTGEIEEGEDMQGSLL